MSFRWPVKDPDETLDYSMDWSRWLGTAVITDVVWFVKTSQIGKTQIDAGETLTAASGNTVTDSIQNIAQTNTNTVATINLGSSVLNREYTFICQITDNTGSTAERSVKLAIRQK